MSVKLRDLAKELGITVTKLRQLVVVSKLDLRKKETVISEDRAAAIHDFLVSTLKEKDIITAVAPAPSQEKLAAGIPIPRVIVLKEFADAIGKPVTEIIMQLMKSGMMINQNENIDYETAEIVADDLGIKIRPFLVEEERVQVSLSELLKEDETKLQPRPPIITILGHVDHGKTTLLDKIRESNVAAGEAGGITQNISAYQINFQGKPITFIDTPGHEAFTAMRSRGARVADIAVLVVAANDGVKPQTIEAIKHARAAAVPILVAITKMDLPEANPDKTKKELAKHDLLVEEWGGKTICVELSAKTGKNLDKLLEMIILAADVEELRANPERKAIGSIIEAHLDNKLGPVATVIIYTGTLHLNEQIVAGRTIGKVRLMQDHLGHKLTEAGPATPVIVAGFQKTPQVGDTIEVVSSPKEAKAKIAKFLKEQDQNRLSLKRLAKQIAGGEIAELAIIIKTDNKGSLQALQQAIAKMQAAEAQIKIVQSEVGEITNSDVMMAKATKAIIIGFHSHLSNQVKAQAEQAGVSIYLYEIIYHLIEELSKTLSGLLTEETISIDTGKAEVLAIFFTGKNEMTIGARVQEGELKLGNKLRFLREDQILGEDKIIMLKREKDEEKTVAAGFECGVKYTGAVRAKEGDKLIAFHFETRKRELTAAVPANTTKP